MKINIAQMLFLTFVAAVLVVVTRPLWMDWDWHSASQMFLSTFNWTKLVSVDGKVIPTLAGFAGFMTGVVLQALAVIASAILVPTFYVYLGSKKDA